MTKEEKENPELLEKEHSRINRISSYCNLDFLIVFPSSASAMKLLPPDGRMAENYLRTLLPSLFFQLSKKRGSELRRQEVNCFYSDYISKYKLL